MTPDPSTLDRLTPAEFFLLADRISRAYSPWTKSDAGNWYRYCPIHGTHIWVHWLSDAANEQETWQIGDNEAQRFFDRESAQAAVDELLLAGGAILAEGP